MTDPVPQRWPGLLQPDVRHIELLPTPARPTSVADELRGRLEGAEGHQASAQLLQDVIGLLGPVHVRSLHLLRPGPAEAPVVSQLQSQIEALAPGIFDAPAQDEAAQAMYPPPSQTQELRSPPNGVAQQPLPPRRAKVAVAAPAPAAAVPPKAPKLRQGGAVATGQPPPGEREVAEAYTVHVTQLLAKHAQLLRVSKEDGEGEDTAMGTGEEEEGEQSDGLPSSSALGSARQQQALLADVKRLAEETMRVCQVPGALQRVGTELLLQLLRLLTVLIEPGASKYIREDEKDSGARMQSIHVAMESATAALRILATPDLPQQVYNEDLLEAVVGLTKFQLANNVYAFHDARFRGPNRPALGEDEDEGATSVKKGAKSAKKGKKATGIRVPAAARALQDRCQSVLGLLSELLGVVPLHTGTLAPLVRVAMQALTVEGIPLLQGKATGLLVAAFQHYPGSRQATIEDFFAHVMNYFQASKRAPRDFVASEDGGAGVQMLTAAVLQMVQASVALPAMDTEVKQLPKCYAPAVHWSDYFWSLCFDRLPAARAAKSDAEQDFKLLLEQLLGDLLEVACVPEWPAASVVLLRFITTLNGPKGLQHGDSYVRQTCVDLLGLVSARLHQFQLAAQADADWLRQTAEQKGSEDPLEIASTLLLQFLADRARGPMAASARHFLLCRSFAEEATSLQRQAAGEEELQQLLASYRRQQDELDSAMGEESGTSPAEARRFMQALLQRTLGNARQSTVLWLLEALDSRQAPTTRAKAVKALGAVVEGDPSVLDLADVQKAVERALQDDSVSVREAALELLGRHISGNQRLAVRLFGTLAKASTDSGTSVRKRAIKILWESCIRQPDFPLATEACKHVLMRASDNEESIQDMVSRVFHSLWFTQRLETGGPGGGSTAAVVDRTPAQRAQQLAEVALAVYEAGGKAIHLPLDLSHPLVVVLRAALGFDAKGDLEKEWAAGREISQALLKAYLQAEEVALADAGQDGAAGNGAPRPAQAHPGFPYMLSLHAFAVTDVELCMPAKDPASFVRTLAPYLKPPAGTAALSEDEKRRGAEELLCVLSVLEGILSQLSSLEALDLDDMVADLCMILNKTSYILVVGAACRCICTIAGKSAAAAPKLAELAAVYYNLLQPGGAQQGAGLVCRFLFTLSQLCRYGADVIERSKAEGKEQVTMQDCLALFCSFFRRDGSADARVQESALQAIGMLTIARPAIMTQSKAAAAILQSALKGAAPHQMKVRALGNLNELLRSDEQQLLARQQEPEDTSTGAKGKASKKKKGGGVVQTQNGQGDNLSLSSGILQYHWENVLQLATDASGGAAVPGSPATGGSGTTVRRQALALIETVLRGGLVAPWTAVAPLVALTTDPNEDLRAKATRLLKQEAEKRSDFLENKLPAGVVEAYEFHARLLQAGATRAPRGVLPKEVSSGLSLLYRELVQPNKALRSSFLQNLLKRFDGACTAVPPGAPPPDLPLLRFCAAVAAELPYKRGDEPCSVVHQINSMVARRGAGVLEDFKAALQSQDESVAPAVLAHCRASLALSMLLLLKDFLKKSYSINAERIAAFGPSGDRRRQEERTPVSQLEGIPCHLDKLDLEAAAAPDKTLQQYKVFKKLMSQDAADYDHLAHAGTGGKRGAAAAAAAGGSGGEGGATNGAAAMGVDGAMDGEAGTPGWVMQGGAGVPATKTAAKRGRKTVTGGTAKGAARTGTASAKTKAGTGKAGTSKKKRKKGSSSDDSEDEDYAPLTAKSTKKRLNL